MSRTLMEQFGDALKENRDLCEKVAAVTAERDKWKLALHSLTPGGSEYCDDPKRCTEYVMGLTNRRWEHSKRVIIENRELRAERDRYKAALEKIINDGNFYGNWAVQDAMNALKDDK